MGAIAIPPAKKPPFKLFGRRTAARNGHDAGRPRLLTANDVAL
jgi:hypothetical protein